jgi:hypothetical protein
MLHHTNLCSNSLNSVEYSIAPQSDSIDRQPDQTPDPNAGKKRKKTRLKKDSRGWLKRLARCLCFIGSLLIIGTVIR